MDLMAILRAHGRSAAALALCILILPGCVSHYRTPGGPAAIGAMTASSVAERLRTVPESPMPATIAWVHVQSSGYSGYRDFGSRRGGISIMGGSFMRSDADQAAVRGWPDVVAAVPLPAMLVSEPPRDSLPEADLLALREGAASLHADILAVFTIDTQFRVDDYSPGPLGLLTLGMAPTKSAVVSALATIAFVDVRTGFVHGTAEGFADDDQLANSWTTDDAVDQCRRRVERTAFEAMLVEAGKAWAGIAAERKAQIASGAASGGDPETE